MSNVIIKSAVSGLYFLDGKGFSATADKATRIMVEDAECVQSCAAKMGVGETLVEDAPNRAIKQNADGSSYAVQFIRPANVAANDPVRGYPGSKLDNPSKRRFATAVQARQHGNRFVELEGHSGFYVISTQDAVNSWVSKATGKTNPIVGKSRTDR